MPPVSPHSELRWGRHGQPSPTAAFAPPPAAEPWVLRAHATPLASSWGNSQGPIHRLVWWGSRAGWEGINGPGKWLHPTPFSSCPKPTLAPSPKGGREIMSGQPLAGCAGPCCWARCMSLTTVRPCKAHKCSPHNCKARASPMLGRMSLS